MQKLRGKSADQLDCLPTQTRTTLTSQRFKGQLVGRLLHLLTPDLRQRELPVLAVVDLAALGRPLQAVVLEDDRRQQVDAIWEALLTLAGAPRLLVGVWAQLCAAAGSRIGINWDGVTQTLTGRHVPLCLRCIWVRHLKSQHSSYCY